MWTTETALVDRLELWLECESIGVTLAGIERQYGACVEVEDARRRLHDVRRLVLAQLVALVAAAPETVH